MLKKLKKASAIVLSGAMAIQFGLADSYYANTTQDEPVQEQQVTSVSVQVSYVDKDGNTLDQTTQDYTIGDVLTPKSFDGYTYESATINGVSASQVTIAQDTTSVQFVYAKVENNTEEVATQELTDEQQTVHEEQPKEENKEETSEEEPKSEEEENKESTQPEEEKKQEEEVKEETKSEEKEDKVSTQDSKESKATTNETTKTYKLYHYALIPGKSMDSAGSPDDTWFGIGVTNISGVDDPTKLSLGTLSGLSYKTESVNTALYPNVTVNGVTYEYAATGTENASKKGYYTLVPARIRVSNGANAGNNEYNPTASGNTYHLDYTMVINEENIYTVTFEVLYPDETQYTALNDYSQRVNSGTSESNLKIPTTDAMQDEQDKDKNTYTFDGWYTDAACTQKANFNGTVTANTFYYGKYVTKEYTVHYDSDGGSSVVDQTSLKYNDKVDTTPTPTKEGYIFKGWYSKDSKVTDSKYSDLAGGESVEEITLKAKWDAVLTASANNVEETYDGNSYGIEVISNKENVRIKYYNSKTGKYDLTECPTQKNFGSKTIKYEVSKDGYTTVYGEATVTINKRNVTLTSETASKPYDGTALTRPNVTVDGNFVAGEVSNIRATGSVTTVAEGKVNNTIVYDKSSDFDANNYIITENIGTLEITPVTAKVTVTIKENSGNATYDGTKHTVTGYTVKSISNELYTENDFQFVGEDAAQTVTETDAGSYDMNLNASDFENTNTNFTNVKFVVEDGQLVVAKRSVTLTSGSDSKVYDGTPLTKNEVTVTSGSFVQGEGYTANATGSQTVSGSSKNAFTYELNNGTKVDNYDITKVEGNLTVTKNSKNVVVTITEHSDTVKYDGKNHTVSGYDVSITEGTNYNVSDFRFVGQDADKKVTAKNADSYSMNLKPTDFENVNEDYTNVTFIIVQGTLTIEKRNVTLTSKSDSKVYDGTALTKKEVEVTGDGFVDSEGATYSNFASITNVDKVSNTYTYKLNDGTNGNNYNITPKTGTLEITPITNKVTVTIKEHGATVLYDGTAHEVTGYDVEISNPLYTTNDFTFEGDAAVSGKDAGTYDMNVKASDFKNISKNFADVEFEVEDGKLVINPRNITLTSGSDSKTYDGTALTNNEVTVTSGSFVQGEGYTATVTGTRTIVGTSDNEFTYDLNEGTNPSNYVIEKSFGKLEVTPITDKVTVTITEHGDKVLYNGNKHEVTGYDVRISNPLYTTNDFTFKGDATVSGKDAGTYGMNVKASDFKNISKNFTNVEFEVEDGQLVIEKRKVTLTSVTDSKTYDGTALTNHNVTVGGDDGFVENEGAYYTDFASITNEGTTPNTFKYSPKTGTDFNNYEITPVYGTLTITPKSIVPDTPDTPDSEKTGITVNDPSNSKYNGEEHKEVLTVKDSKTNTTLVEGTDYDVAYTGDLKNVGEVTITVTGKGNYTGTFEKKYNITQRQVTLTSETASKPYDGTALTRPTVTVGADKFVAGEVSNIRATGSVTTVEEGEMTNTIAYDTIAGKFDSKNYNITKTEGKLSITAKSIVPDTPDTPDSEKTGITVNDPSNSKYDGKEHKESLTVTDTKTGKGLKAEKDYDVAYTGDLKNVGEVTITVTGKGNYTGTFEKKYNITKRAVELTSATDSKTYDGTALTNHNVTVGGEDGFVEGEGAEYTYTGSQTETGSSENVFDYTLNENTLAGNYEITKHFGTLTVNPIGTVTVTIKGKTDTKVYDGTEKKVSGYEVTHISDSKFKETDIKFAGTAEAKGTEVGTYPMGLKKAQFTSTNKNFKTVVFVVEDGSLEITPKSIVPDGPNTPDEKKTGITVSDPKDSKYDGKEHKEVLTVTDTKTNTTLAEGTDYEVAYSDDLINVGKVTITVTGKGNYTGKFEKTYNITKRVVELTSATASKTYDGTALTKHDVAVGEDGFVEGEGAEYTYTGSQTNEGTSDNYFTYVLKKNTLERNYTITKAYGKLTVNPVKDEVVIKIQGNTGKYVYDGQEKTVSGYTTAIGNKLYKEADFTFSGNAEVKGTNVKTYPMGLKAEDFKNNNKNFAKVTFEVEDGLLEITPKSIVPDGPNTPDEKKTGITVSDPKDSKYDGKEHKEKLTVTDTKTGNELVAGTDYSVAYSEDLVNVGEVTITIKGKGNYEGTFTKKYNITKRSVKLSSETASKTYDGNKLTRPDVKVDGDGFVSGEVTDLKAIGTITNVGSVTNEITYNTSDKFKEGNYNIEKSEGTLTVVKQSIVPDPENPETYGGITISDPSDVEYDGADHKWIPIVKDKVGNVLNENEAYEVSYDTTDFKDVKTIKVTIKGIENYTGSVTKMYKITPKKYTITTYGGTKVYDGRALTNFGRVEGIVVGETYSFKTTGSQTEVGQSDNTYEFKFDGSAKSKNYVLDNESIGKLVVTAKSIVPDTPDTPDSEKTGITVSDPSDSKYDGKEHREVLTVTDSKTGNGLVSGTDYDVTYSDDLVNAGTVTITVTGKGNYDGTFKKTYKITAREITLTSASDSKTYDGSALTNDSIEVSGDGFVEGEGATYEVTGSQTEVGNSANAFEYSLNKNTLASNYKITKVVGTLTVTRNSNPTTPTTPTTPNTPSNPGTTTPALPRVIQRIVNVINPTPNTTPSENVEDNRTPKAQRETETVEEDYTPKATRKYYWALINLICAILTVLFGLLLLISKRHKDDDDEEDEDDETKEATREEDEEEGKEAKKRGLFTRVLAVLIAILSVVLFVFTEDMSLPWTWVDKWTVWMVVIGLVQILVFVIGRKWKKDDDEEEDEDEQAQQA